MGLQSCESPNFGNFETSNLRVPGQSDIWVVALWLGTKNTIRGWLPPSSNSGESCEFVFAFSSSVHQKCFNYALTNLLFGFYTSIWIIDSLVIPSSPHPEAPTRPFTPEVLRTKERTPTLYPSVAFTLNTKLNLSRSLRVHHLMCDKHHSVLGSLNLIVVK
jgi:hypothetical protein